MEENEVGGSCSGLIQRGHAALEFIEPEEYKMIIIK